MTRGDRRIIRDNPESRIGAPSPGWDNTAWLDLAFILLAGAALLGAMFYFLGVQTAGDTPRYLAGASRLASGQSLVGDQVLYPGYIYPLFFILRLNPGQAGIVAWQGMLSLAAGAVLYVAARKDAGRLPAILAALLFFAPNIQRWNLYILTDGPADSLLAIAVATALLTRHSRGWLVICLAALAWLDMVRPEAFLLSAPFALYFGLRRWWAPAAAMALLGLIMGFAQTQGGITHHKLLENWHAGTIMWEFSTMSRSPGMAYPQSEPLWLFLARLLIHDPLWLAEVMARRAFWFFFHSYPPRHPAWYAVAAPLASLFYLGFAFLGTMKTRLKQKRAWLLWGVLAVYLGLTCLTFAISDGRFLTRCFAVLCLPAGSGLAYLWGRPRRAR